MPAGTTHWYPPKTGISHVSVAADASVAANNGAVMSASGRNHRRSLRARLRSAICALSTAEVGEAKQMAGACPAPISGLALRWRLYTSHAHRAGDELILG